MPYPQILHHGATDGVTGSCHQLLMDAHHSLLIDCGLFQGEEASADGRSGADRLAIEFSLDGIQALLATHVHIDHVGRIPYLLAAGFQGPILCSEPSARLLPIVLEDAFKLGFSRDQRQVERYLSLIEQRIIAVPYDTWFTLQDTEHLQCRLRLQRAGHILGSAYAEIDLHYPASGESKRIVFSGDLGASHTPLLRPPESPERADTLILESTYGDRLHEDRQRRRERLRRVIERALEDKGTVLIPAFSIGRTQELLYELEGILHEQRASGAEEEGDSIWANLPIILDSPLASRFTRVYRELQPFWNDEAQQLLEEGRKPLGFEQLLTVDSHQEHLAMVRHLAESARPAVVIAGNGMCSNGRIINYLKAMLGDNRHNVLFVGYQARGTPGHAIQLHGPNGGYVSLDGERYTIRAGVDSIGGYSAHADQEGLVGFVTGMREWPSEIRLVHGDNPARTALAQRLRERYACEGRQAKIILPGQL